MKAFILKETNRFINYKFKKINKRLFYLIDFKINNLQLSKKKYGEILSKHSIRMEIKFFEIIKDKLPKYINQALKNGDLIKLTQNDYCCHFLVKHRKKKVMITCIFLIDFYQKKMVIKTFYPTKKNPYKQATFMFDNLSKKNDRIVVKYNKKRSSLAPNS